MAHDTIVVLDFGSQYAQLIARRLREQHVYSELVPWDEPGERVLANPQVRGLVLSGGPASVYEPGAPTLPPWVLKSGLPVLGICYGMQLLAHHLGGRVAPAAAREYGPAQVEVLDPCDPLMAGFAAAAPGGRGPLPVWMSHGDRIEALPPGWHSLARSVNAPYAAMGDPGRGLYGVQFHPEVTHTPQGAALLRAFAVEVCGALADWTPANFVVESVESIRQQVGPEHVLCGLSGGVDSAVAAALLHKAIGDRLTCLFVDHGLLRQGEATQVIDTFQRHMQMRLVAINAAEAFLTDLQGVTDPEEKRRRIGNRFVRVFEEEAARIVAQWQQEAGSRPSPGAIGFLAQGTLYPDVIESASGSRERAARTIKTHHNVGGLPADMTFRLIEPLRWLFKDEVRAVGEALGLPEEIVWRHPFPGPGLAIRVLGEVTWERLETLRRADAILLEELRRAGLYRQTAQVFAVLLPVKSVGVMGDNRTYADVVALRAVTTDDFMTADWARLPYDLLARVSNRIVNEVPGVNRVVYDITSKPPGTIEWE
ncbi:MAG: glutamine-hydrolyzing GMP synthase [Caldilineales bacterium]|nr:glutamine-hydrolyzing GMP synthase [Caldilineales bacterium]MDW8317062.1 glutamine-hydrolyzing GMP synthase [Anaerolineae bacterium]